MAKLLYANDGSVELMPETMAALRSLPTRWRVILNARPAGVHDTREIDALVITERALHVIEFKYRKGVAEILGDGPWTFGGYPEQPSPAIQVVKTSDAFKTWLSADADLRHLKNALLPWVVLERSDANHRFGQAHMRLDRSYSAGHSKVLNGVQRLQDMLLQLEVNRSNKLPWQGIQLETDVRLLVERMGARPLDTLTVQGQVQSLAEGRALAGIRLRVQSTATVGPLAGFSQEVDTDQHGRFAVYGAPIAEFTVEFCGAETLPGWMALPQVPVHPRTSLALVNLYLVQPGLAEEQVQTLLKDALGQVKSEISALQEWLHEQDTFRQANEERIRLLEERASQYPETTSMDLTDLWAELDALRATQNRMSELEEADVRAMAQEALAPLESELKTLAARMSKLEEQLTVTAHRAESAEEASRRAAAEAKQSRIIQAERLGHDRTVYQVAEERRAKRADALKLSAIVGAAGGILSMQPLPFADNVLLAPMQIWLVVRIGLLYGQRVGQDAALKLLGTLGFGFAAQHATVALYKLIPGLTFGLGPFTVFGFTVLLGAMTARFYERGQMPAQSEQRAVMNSIRTLLKDRNLASELLEMGTTVAAEFKARGYKTRPEDLQAIFGTVNERAKPIGERLERELFRDDPKDETKRL